MTNRQNQLLRQSHTHTPKSLEHLSPDLTKGSLLHASIDGSTAIFDGIFQGNPVIIKETNDPSTIPMIQKEHDFLLSPPIGVIDATLQDYGIPSNWKIQTRFVKLINQAVTPEMYKRGVTVLEKAQGKALAKESTADATMPFKFHFGALMGYLDMMRQLARKNVALDSNIDTDLLVMPDIANRRLNVVRIDCMPSAEGASNPSFLLSPNNDQWLKINRGGRNLTYEQLAIDQVIEIANKLYGKNNQAWNFLGSMIPALTGRFKEADIHDTETFFNRFKTGLENADWQDDFVQNGDTHRLHRWVGGSF